MSNGDDNTIRFPHERTAFGRKEHEEAQATFDDMLALAERDEPLERDDDCIHELIVAFRWAGMVANRLDTPDDKPASPEAVRLDAVRCKIARGAAALARRGNR